MFKSSFRSCVIPALVLTLAIPATGQKAQPKPRPAAAPAAKSAPAQPAAPAVKVPLYLFQFSPSIYDAERGIDGALLLTDAQKAQIAGLTEALRDEEERLLEQSRKAETKEAQKEAAKERAKFAAKSRSKIRAIVQPVLTPAQSTFVASAEALFKESAAFVEEDFRTRFADVTGAARAELEKAKPEMIAATFSYRLDEMLSDAQESGLAGRDAEIRAVLQREKARQKAREVAQRKLEERRKAEEARKNAELAKQGFGSFEAGASKHVWSNAYLLSLAAHYAYPKQLGIAVADFDDHELFEDKFAAKIIPMGIDTVEFMTDDNELTVDAEAVVFSNDKIVVVDFRGSEGPEENTVSGLKDWVATDFNFGFTKLDGYGSHAAVHTGMWNAASRIYRAVKDEVARQGGKDKKVWITGHSLGGGMAGVFAARYLKDGGKVQGLVTFAAPRIGNGDFNDFIASRAKTVQRWVHKNDIIPMLPPDIDLDLLDNLDGYSGRNGAYSHFGQTNNICKDGKVRLNDAETRVPCDDYLLGDVFQHYSQYYARGVYFNMPQELRDLMPPPPPKP
jgi:hypothetical protein